MTDDNNNTKTTTKKRHIVFTILIILLCCVLFFIKYDETYIGTYITTSTTATTSSTTTTTTGIVSKDTSSSTTEDVELQEQQQQQEEHQPQQDQSEITNEVIPVESQNDKNNNKDNDNDNDNNNNDNNNEKSDNNNSNENSALSFSDSIQQHNEEVSSKSSSSAEAVEQQAVVVVTPKEKIDRLRSLSKLSPAIQFVQNRYDEYMVQNLTIARWRMRGIGYIYWYWNMLLHAEIPILPKPGTNVVIIRNLLANPSIGHSIKQTNCHLWTFWVRVNGPEIFAGTANAVYDNSDNDNNEVNDGCHWEFPFDLQIAGSYEVDAKLLYYNATSMMGSSCRMSPGKVPDDIYSQYPVHAGFKGFKMYQAPEMCCEICSRLWDDCYYWATPPFGLENSGFFNNGCELFFKDNTSEWIPIHSTFVNNSHLTTTASSSSASTIDAKDQQLRKNKYHHHHQYIRMRRRRRTKENRILADSDMYHGPVHEKRPLYFLGCGWSFWMTLDFPCLNGGLDDRIYVTGDNNHQNYITFTLDNNADISSPDASSSVAVTTTTTTTTTSRYRDLPLCTIDSEKSENHYGRWVRGPWPDDEACPVPFERDEPFSDGFTMHRYDPDRPECYYKEDITIMGHYCAEMNCRFIEEYSKWYSSIHMEDKFYATWQNYDCRYLEYTNNEIQQCINERKISEITGSGRSIWENIQRYLKQRLHNITLYDAAAVENDNDIVTVHVSTLAMLHHEEDLPQILEEMPLIDDPNKKEYYWINSLYLSSEREHHARGPHQLDKISIARSILEPKNYKMLNFYDMTKAFTFDTAGQMDGMHIIGPPMKMLMTKLFHYLCINTTISTLKQQQQVR